MGSIIPSQSRMETVRREHDDLVKEAQSEGEEEPYFEFEWLGEVHSYSAAGYWLRILFVAILFGFTALMLVAAGRALQAFLLLLLMGGAMSISLLMLRNYRKWH